MFEKIIKKIIDFLTYISKITEFIANTLRNAGLHEEYYVFLPNRNKPRHIHRTYKSAIEEAQRLKALLEKQSPDLILDEEIQILQIVKKIESEIPF